MGRRKWLYGIKSKKIGMGHLAFLFDRQQRQREQRRHNMRLASCGVTSLNSSSFFQLGFGAGLTVLCSETPHERQEQKRYRAF